MTLECWENTKHDLCFGKINQKELCVQKKDKSFIARLKNPFYVDKTFLCGMI